jgi:cytochrome oxidase assembly protein ShyY1
MKKLPMIPTLLVGLAVATMLGLGFWQLARLHEKEAALAQFGTSSTEAAVPFPDKYGKDDAAKLLFRKATGYCALVTEWNAVGGQNTKGDSGWKHIASCFTGEANGQPMPVDIGWSRDKANPDWAGGQVSGIITEGAHHELRLIADAPAPGLELSAPPSLDSIPNNHLAYALQWFAFAGIALVIYLLALRRRSR